MAPLFSYEPSTRRAAPAAAARLVMRVLRRELDARHRLICGVR